MRSVPLALSLFSFLFIGCGKQLAEMEISPIPRPDFEALVINKTEEEVLKSVGKPLRTSESLTALRWFYQNRTYDPQNNRTDIFALVSFNRRTGRVQYVHY